ncbi:MAG TPA: PIG-L deacetylase family protein [Acidimicrobiia bacterium]
MDEPLAVFPDDWERALAVVAHPDDLEYGAASAIARWTSEGKHVVYLLVTRGEAGIDGLAPVEVGPARTAEEIASAAVVGVDTVEFLDGYVDGLVEYGLPLRRDLAHAIRRHRPELLVSINYRDRWARGSPINHADHRNVGRALLDAARDAANRWVFTEQLAAGLEPCAARWAVFNGSPAATHAVDVTGFLDRGIASLREHRTYLEGLGEGSTDEDEFLRGAAESAGARQGVVHAVAFELVPL